MPGIDSYTKLLIHCNGTDGSTSFSDDSGNSRTVTAYGTAQVDTAQSKFGGASVLLDGNSDYLLITDHNDFNLDSGDFTIDFWVRFNSVSAAMFYNHGGMSSIQLFYEADSRLYFYVAGTGAITRSCSWIPSINTWYHIAYVRNGSTLYIFIDGVSQTLDSSLITSTFPNWDTDISIGQWNSGGGYFLNGWMDEIRLSVGVARWTSNFTPPTEEYSLPSLTLSVSDSISLSDTFNVQINPDNKDVFDTINLSDNWNIQSNPEQENIDELLNIIETWSIQPNPDLSEVSETIFLSDNWLVDMSGTFFTKISTKLYTILSLSKAYFTDFRTIFNSIKIFTTKLYTKFLSNTSYNTDLRIKYEPYNNISIGTLDNFIVKLDGTELLDVDYNSLTITLNLNTTPSSAQFILARRHDNLDVMINGNSSVITNENKIEIFDGTRKLFTGYISEIFADSQQDIVKVTVHDCRLKMSKLSMELEYGGTYQIDTNHNEIPDDDDNTDDIAFNYPDYIKFEKSINDAFLEVMASVGSLVSGYDLLPFSGSFTPEYIKVEKDYVSLIDELIRQTANCNWYIDENERLRFQKISNGEIKTLNLSNLNSHRHPYDLIINDIQLNKQPNGYAKSLLIKRGKNIINNWATRTFRGWINLDFVKFMQSLTEKTTFVFHQRGDGPFNFDDEITGNGPFYTGMNGLAIAYYNATMGGWVSYPTIIVQWENKKSSLNLPDLTIGSGFPVKTFYLTSYGKKISNRRYSEDIKVGENPNNTISASSPTSDKAYLTEIQDENYDYTDYLLDLAHFELSQNNKLQTTATISMLLDAYFYYNISFSNLINLSNTIESGIYNNNNGFPLNIKQISINCKTRTVSLDLSNEGKSWYAKSKNVLSNYIPPFSRYIERKWIWRVITSSGEELSTE